MIVVDTSVWIDVLNNRATRQAKHCVALIEDGQPVALTDVIFTEILQGISSVDDAARVERHLRAFPSFVSPASTTSRWRPSSIGPRAQLA